MTNSARIHSVHACSVNEYSKGISTKYPLDSIEYIDDKSKLSSVSCGFTAGWHSGKIKGSLEL